MSVRHLRAGQRALRRVLRIVWTVSILGCASLPPATSGPDAASARPPDASTEPAPDEPAASPSVVAPEPSSAHHTTETILGVGPDDVVVMDWTRNDDKRSGRAALRLPNGIELAGTWVEQDNVSGGQAPSSRVVSPHPSADPSDPTRMTAPPTARQWVVQLRGEGVEIQCTIPVKIVARTKSSPGTGECRAQAGERFKIKPR